MAIPKVARSVKFDQSKLLVLTISHNTKAFLVHDGVISCLFCHTDRVVGAKQREKRKEKMALTRVECLIGPAKRSWSALEAGPPMWAWLNYHLRPVSRARRLARLATPDNGIHSNEALASYRSRAKVSSRCKRYSAFGTECRDAQKRHGTCRTKFVRGNTSVTVIGLQLRCNFLLFVRW